MELISINLHLKSILERIYTTIFLKEKENYPIAILILDQTKVTAVNRTFTTLEIEIT